jgi:hypothetical protein
MEDEQKFVEFLIEAKRKTYAGGGREAPSSRPASKDLPFEQGEYLYLDSYLGGFHFIGEEAVWKGGVPLWGMNYYGRMHVSAVPEGFSHFLKEAMLRVSINAPYRGPRNYREGGFEYQCEWQGSLEDFRGEERILLDGQVIYSLYFHGGGVKLTVFGTHAIF